MWSQFVFVLVKLLVRIVFIWYLPIASQVNLKDMVQKWRLPKQKKGSAAIVILVRAM